MSSLELSLPNYGLSLIPPAPPTPVTCPASSPLLFLSGPPGLSLPSLSGATHTHSVLGNHMAAMAPGLPIVAPAPTQTITSLSNGVHQTLRQKRTRMDDDEPTSDLSVQIPVESLSIQQTAKKTKVEPTERLEPSKVLHIRRVPPDVQESEIANLAVPFGSINNLLVAKKNGQAWMELESIEAALRMATYYESHPPLLRNCHEVIVQFSKYQELHTETPSMSAMQAVRNANSIVANVNGDEPRTVLLVKFETNPPNTLFTLNNHITLEVMYKIFSVYGTIEKIIIFTKQGQPQALVQYSRGLEAYMAKVNLNNTMFTPNCTIRVEFSKMRDLSVRNDHVKARDFTRHPMSDTELSQMSPPTLPTTTTIGTPNPLSLTTLNNTISTHGVPNITMANSHLNAPSSLPGHLQFYVPPSPSPGHENFPTSNPDPSSLCLFDGEEIFQYPFAIQQSIESLPFSHMVASQLPRISQDKSNAAAAAVGLGLMQVPGFPGLTPTANLSLNPYLLSSQSMAAAAGVPLNKILLVSNLDTQSVSPDDLFTLFGVYGDVIRVKIMFNKKGNALIQYNHESHAKLALENLNGIPLCGRPMKIAYSKHLQVQMPKEGADQGLTKDYANSSLHRYKKPFSKNYNNIFPPSPILHLSNIPPEMTEHELLKIFRDFNFDPINFKFLQKEKKMALVQLDSVETSVMALIKLHDYKLNDNYHLRVSFSKAVI